MKTKIQTISILGVSILMLGGCQAFQNSAQEVRSKFDQTVNQANQIKTGVENQVNDVKNKVEDVKTKLGETKENLDKKIEQINQAGQKITEAQKAINDANEAVKKVSQ